MMATDCEYDMNRLNHIGDDLIAAFNDGYAHGKADGKPKWIPVTERLPEIGKKVLVFAYGHDVLTARLRKETENDYPVFECNGIYLEMAKQGRITHWMPLPQTPEEESGEV